MARLGAGVRKRADGTLEKRFTVNGRRYSVYGKNTKEITRNEQQMRQDIEAGLYRDNRNITLDKYFEEFIESKRNEVKSNSIRAYKSLYEKHISKKMGDRKVQQIEKREILLLQREMAKNLSITSCNYALTVLKCILNSAVDDGIIIKNPADSVKALKDTNKKASETYHRALTEEEQRAFMQELRSEYYYEFIAFLLCTGMRMGEASALMWEDIDLKNNVIHITKTMTANEKSELFIGDTPKSDAGKRDIPLTETTRQILSSQRAKYGGVHRINKNHIFLSIYGKYIRGTAINDTITRTLKRLEEKGIFIEHFTAHALRDTFATRFIEQGGQPQTLKTILGHSRLAMTMDLYAHVLPNTKQKEMDNLYIAL